MYNCKSSGSDLEVSAITGRRYCFFCPGVMPLSRCRVMRVTSTPLRDGRSRSINTTSNDPSRLSFSALVPSAATVTE